MSTYSSSFLHLAQHRFSKSKEIKKETTEKEHTQTNNDQTNKQSNKQRNKKKQKNKQAMSRVFFFVRCNGWSHCVRPSDTNKKVTSKQPREPTQTHKLNM